jgi:holliday junction DNA helicase RuvB
MATNLLAVGFSLHLDLEVNEKSEAVMAELCSASPIFDPPEQLNARPIVRRLVSGLSARAVEKKIQEAERLSEAGDRELAFYLAEFKARRIYKDRGYRSFADYIRNRTGIGVHRAADLARIGKRLLSLPELDSVFARGEASWTAVRAAAAIATPETDAAWAEFSKKHRAEEVERRAAQLRPHEDPRSRDDFDCKPVKFPYSFLVTAEVHQAFEFWFTLLGKERGHDVTVSEGLFEAVLLATQICLAKEEERAKNGEERKLPAAYRKVIFQIGEGKTFAIPTAAGLVRIGAEVADRLLEDAEVIHMTLPEAEKLPGREVFESQASAYPHAHKLPDSGEADRSVDALIEHAADLSTIDKPAVPVTDRDQPASAELVKRILSRDPICRIPGCRHISERAHHIVFLEHGGPTIESMLVGVCIPHHHMIHAGLILVSGTACDLRVSDANGRPLLSQPTPEESPVRIEIEPRPPELSAPAVDPMSAADLDLPARSGAPLPAEIDRDFWRKHRQAFEWSEKRKAIVYRPERGHEALERPVTSPPAAPPSRGGLTCLRDFHGQRRVVENLSLAIEAARKRDELPPPILLSGPPGLGKSTLSKLIAREVGSPFRSAQGPSLVDLGSLIGILADLEKDSILFVDEIHRLPAPMGEILYQALDEGAVSIPVVTGERTALVKLHLESFLLVGATTEESLLPRPLLSRFSIRERLEYYSIEDLGRLAERAARAMGIEIDAEAAHALASCARGTPRHLLAHLARARDLAQIEGTPITESITRRSLEMAGLDRAGLSATDRRILEILIARGRPLGLRSLSDLLGESPRTLAEVYEPHLLREGYLIRTSRGRCASERAVMALAG